MLAAGAALIAGATVPRWAAGAVAPLGPGAPKLKPPPAGPPRCVALGPAGCIAPGSAQDLRAAGNADLLAGSGTGWVRLWADWPSLMPAPEAFHDARVAALDAQLAQARTAGLQTILTLYRFPAWAGGGPGLMNAPADVSETSPWGRFVAWAIARYAPTLDFLELCNEPNLMWRGPAATPQTVAAMFATGQRIAGGLGSPLALAGPATADAPGHERFNASLLDALDAAGFAAGPRFAWTHHNYGDVAYGTNRAAAVRAALVGRWAGWSAADAAQPQVLLTEGGVTLTTIARRLGIAGARAQRAKQAELVRAGYERAADTPGIALVTQYLLHTDPRYDSGLCESGGAPRPAFEAWRALPAALPAA
jgi:hypothetical protein